jgi:hypothetical protein
MAACLANLTRREPVRPLWQTHDSGRRNPSEFTVGMDTENADGAVSAIQRIQVPSVGTQGHIDGPTIRPGITCAPSRVETRDNPVKGDGIPSDRTAPGVQGLGEI